MNSKFLQHVLKNGFLFKKCLKELEGSQHYSLTELEELQNEKLKSVIKICYEGVPFYRRIFDLLKLKPEDIKTKQDLQKLPIIDKNTLRNHYHELINRKFRGLRFKAFSSGTTGNPSITLRDLNSINYENAALWRQFGWGGRKGDDTQAILRGEWICPADQKSPPFWKYRFWSNELTFSSYHLSDSIMMYYVEKIEKFKPSNLYAYPSTAYVFANFCRRFGINISFKSVFTSSEMLFDFQKREIEEVFRCRLFDWYGNAERVSAIGQCEEGSYHEMSDYSITEYIPLDSNEFEIVGTTLNNRVMPLLRYNTKDIIQIKEHQSCACKKHFPVVSRIVGRHNDCLQFKDGRKIQLIDNLFKGFDSIKEAQILQKDYEHITIKIVPLSNYTLECEKKMLSRLQQYLPNHSIHYEFLQVESIKRTANGKFQLIKSLID